MSLEIIKTTHSVNPWRVRIAKGPSTGAIVKTFPLKRDAQAWIDEHAHLPWEYCIWTVDEARESEALIVTIPNRELAWLLQERYFLKAELEVHKKALWHGHDAIVAGLGYGTAHLVDRIKRGEEL